MAARLGTGGRRMFARSSGQLLHRAHIRRAPFDGLSHLTGEIVYTSLTQLLIRQSLFTGIGLFSSRWGSVGDFNWNMRACLVANTVHLPPPPRPRLSIPVGVQNQGTCI